MVIDETGVLISCPECQEAERVVIPEGVREIAPKVFKGANRLREIILPEGVEVIGESAFEYCTNLKTFTMPDSVVKLGCDVFYDCRSLSNIRLSAGLNDIPDDAFYGCHDLLSVYVPDGVESIGDGAFASCSGMKSIRLPNSLKTIEKFAFHQNRSLKSLTLPDGLEEAVQGAFLDSAIEHISRLGMEIFRERRNMLHLGNDLWFTKEFSDELRAGTLTSRGISTDYMYPFLIAHFAKSRDHAAGKFIREQFDRIFPNVIKLNNIPAVEAVIEYGGMLTAENIDKYIKLAIELERREIYLMLAKEWAGGERSDNAGRFNI